MSAVAASPRVTGSYVPLFNVQFRHGYYNAAGGACRDFAVMPTPDCAQLMASLGMIFKDLGAGFSVLIDQARIPALIAYLSAHYAAARPGRGYWTRLSFLLASSNPGLLGITRLPIATDPLAQCLYTSNLDAEDEGGTLMLCGSAGPAANALYPLSGASIAATTPPGGSAALCDLSGAAVPVATSASGTSTRFTMSGVPYGYYSVAVAGKNGKPSGAPTDYVYAPGTPAPFALIDLLLTQPVANMGEADAFPVAPMPAPKPGAPAPSPAVAGVDLVLPFQSRQTYWNYYICSQDRAAKFAPGLHITGSGTTFAKSLEQLPNGDSAVLFAAKTPLPLQQVSQYRFQLSGQRHGANGSRDAVSVAWLPAAPASPVWPAPSGDPLAGSSEIYVYV